MFFIIFPAPKRYLAILSSCIKREEPIKKYCQVPPYKEKSLNTQEVIDRGMWSGEHIYLNIPEAST